MKFTYYARVATEASLRPPQDADFGSFSINFDPTGLRKFSFAKVIVQRNRGDGDFLNI